MNQPSVQLEKNQHIAKEELVSLSIRPDDTRLTWAGAVSFDYSDGAVMPWRIPFEERDLFGATRRWSRVASSRQSSLPSSMAFFVHEPVWM